jgi:hypothetical protein
MNNKYNNKYNNNIRVFKELQVSTECSYLGISSKDSFNRVVAFFGHRSAYDDNNNNTSPIDEHKKIDPINKMMTITSNPTPTDGTQMPGSTNQAAVVSTLPTTLVQVNTNESTLSATAEDDNDATVQTSNSNTTKQAWMSYNIKLLLTSKQDTSDSALQHAMLTILETIDREMGADVKIFDGAK